MAPNKSSYKELYDESKQLFSVDFSKESSNGNTYPSNRVRAEIYSYEGTTSNGVDYAGRKLRIENIALTQEDDGKGGKITVTDKTQNQYGNIVDKKTVVTIPVEQAEEVMVQIAEALQSMSDELKKK